MQQFNSAIIIIEVYIKDIKLVIREPKIFHFNYDLPGNIEKNLKYEIDLIIKLIESLAKYKLKNKIKQTLSRYKHGNNIHEHIKQQNEWTTQICFQYLKD